MHIYEINKKEFAKRKNKKSWEKLIPYFPLIWHGPYRKRRPQQFFVAAGKCLPNRCLETIGVYIVRPTNNIENDASNIASIVACIRCSANVFTEPLPSNDRGNIRTDTETDERGL
jgi:hypothetical protein